MKSEFIDSLEYLFIRPFKEWHRHYKIGDLVWVRTRLNRYYPQFAIIVQGPFDRYDRKAYWKKTRSVKKVLYKIFLVEDQVETVCHFNRFERK